MQRQLRQLRRKLLQPQPGGACWLPANKLSNIKHVIAVVSGKGGVGKSTVTSMMAVAMNKLGYKTAILDADITARLFRRRSACMTRGRKR